MSANDKRAVSVRWLHWGQKRAAAENVDSQFRHRRSVIAQRCHTVAVARATGACVPCLALPQRRLST